MRTPEWKPIIAAAGLVGGWSFATWFLEGRIETLLRPEATVDRIVYAVVANLLIGVVGAAAVLRYLISTGAVTRRLTGFPPGAPSPKWLILALALGFAFYFLQGAPSLDPVVLANAYCQVLVVSIAEVLVCWAVVSAAMESLLQQHGRVMARTTAAVSASVLFGFYHFAHSAPFNNLGMVALLAGIGLVTSAFFIASRDIYATILFHNFLGEFGVVQALAASDRLGALAVLQLPLFVMAAATVGVLGLADWGMLRSAHSRGGDMEQTETRPPP